MMLDTWIRPMEYAGVLPASGKTFLIEVAVRREPIRYACPAVDWKNILVPIADGFRWRGPLVFRATPLSRGLWACRGRLEDHRARSSETFVARLGERRRGSGGIHEAEPEGSGKT
jgi:hypothetical protein